MLPFFSSKFGNAASRHHAMGRRAEQAVEHAAEQVANLIGADPREIVWTSGATESNNLAIRGVAEQYRDKGRHIITAVHEHKAVIDPCRRLQKDGFDLTWLTPSHDAGGLITADQVRDAIRDDTILVSIMAANNEIGTVNNIDAIGRICKENGVLFHTDAAQLAGKMPVNVNLISGGTGGIDLLSMSGHKMYGPKGIGCLYVRRRGPRVRLTPMIDGGGHQRGMRPGTLNVPGIVGMGMACEVCANQMDDEAQRLTSLRDRLEDRITSELEHVSINGDRNHRLPHVSNMSFHYIEAESLMMSMRDVAISAGAACSSASTEPSYVLRALGLSDDLAHGSIRFSLGRFTTNSQIDLAIEKTVAGAKRLLDMSPLYEMVQAGIDPNQVEWS
jgi:cysteine desulfurase